MCTLQLTQGKVTIVDPEQFDALSQFSWSFNKKGPHSGGYAQRTEYKRLAKGKYKSTTIYLHRQLLSFPEGSVDHINGNTLDNRLENLRIVSHEMNMRNRSPVSKGSSKFTGVHLHKLTGRWRAQITISGIHISLGLFASQEEAYAARVEYIVANELEGFRR